MIELRSKHYKFVRKDIIRKLYDKYRAKSGWDVTTASISIAGQNLTGFRFERFRKQVLKRRRIYIEFLPEQYQLIKNIIKLEEFYDLPLIGEGISSWYI